MLGLRMFADGAGRMNRSVRDVAGGVLIVPQFTLAADTRGGNRPGFSPAADPERGRALYARSDQAEDYRSLVQEAFVAGYRIGAAEALLVLG